MLDASFEHDLVYVAVESGVRKAGKLINASPVIVLLLGPFAESIGFTVCVCQDAGATGV